MQDKTALAILRRGDIMAAISPNRAGLVLGALLGGWHFVWSLLVAAGLAQSLIDFVFWIHFIKPVYLIEPFAFGQAAILVLATAIIGYITGFAFALLWNRVLSGEIVSWSALSLDTMAAPIAARAWL
jgi:hypothetical protein